MMSLLDDVPSPNNLQYLYLFDRKTVKRNCAELLLLPPRKKRAYLAEQVAEVGEGNQLFML